MAIDYDDGIHLFLCWRSSIPEFPKSYYNGLMKKNDMLCEIMCTQQILEICFLIARLLTAFHNTVFILDVSEGNSISLISQIDFF